MSERAELVYSHPINTGDYRKLYFVGFRRGVGGGDFMACEHCAVRSTCDHHAPEPPEHINKALCTKELDAFEPESDNSRRINEAEPEAFAIVDEVAWITMRLEGIEVDT